MHVRRGDGCKGPVHLLNERLSVHLKPLHSIQLEGDMSQDNRAGAISENVRAGMSTLPKGLYNRILATPLALTPKPGRHRGSHRPNVNPYGHVTPWHRRNA